MNITPILKILNETIGLSHESIGETHIKKAVFNRMAICRIETVSEYQQLITESDAELNELINLVVIPETWFFRDQVPFDALTHYVKTNWLPQNANNKLKILSLPCATGEEPYSIVMTLLEMGLSPNQFTLDAIDISDRVIDIAESGVYSAYSFRGDKNKFREKYFEMHDEGFEITKNIRESVNFMIGNIFDAAYEEKMEYYDVLFCRNLLIYFDRGMKDKAIKVLYGLLKDNGALFVGLAETARLSLWGFTSMEYPQSFAYIKTGKNVVNAATLNDIIKMPAEKHYRATAKIGSGVVKGEYRAKRQESHENANNINIKYENSNDDGVVHPQNAIRMEKIAELLEENKINEAEELCEKLLMQNDLSAELYYCMGQIADARENSLLSEEYYMRAIYLDPNHYNALMHLYALARKKNNESKASMYLRRADRAKHNKKN